MTFIEFPQDVEDEFDPQDKDAAERLSSEAAGVVGRMAPFPSALSTLSCLPSLQLDEGSALPGRREGESERDYVTRVFGVHVMEIRHGHNVTWGVYRNNALVFESADSDLVSQLRRHGVHPSNALFGSGEHREVNYLDYVRNLCGQHVVSVRQGSRQSYQTVVGDRVIEVESFADLQRELEAAGIAANPRIETNQPLVVLLPNGNSRVHFPDRSTVTVDGSRQVVSVRDSRGNDFRRVPGAAQESWESPLGTWNGSFRFEQGTVSFAFRDNNAGRAQISMNGRGRIEESFSDGARAVYSNGRLLSFSDRNGSITLETSGSTLNAVTLRAPGDAQGRRFTAERNGSFTADGATQRDLANAHTRLAEIQERLGLGSDALRQRVLAATRMENLYTPGDTTVATYHDHVVRLANANGQGNVGRLHLAEAQEVRRVASYLDELGRASDPAATTAIILRRLPQQIRLDSEGNRLYLGTSNFLTLLQAIPGFRTSELSSLSGERALTIDDDRIRLSGRGTIVVPTGGAQNLTISLDDLSGRMRLDPRDNNRILLSDISGLSASQMGADIDIREMSFALRSDDQGNMTLIVTPGRLEGRRQLNPNGQPSAAQNFNQLAAGFASTQVRPIELPIGNSDDSPIPQLFSEFRRWAEGREPRDARRLAETISGMYVDPALAGIFGGIRGVERNGEQITIRSTGSDAHNLGGLPINWDQTVRARLRLEGNRMSLTNIEGIRIRMPVPSDVASSIGMNNPIEISITELSLSDPDRDGNRTATMRTSGVLESISIKVGPQMQPVTDRNGNTQLNALLNQGGRIPLELTFNPQQIAAGDPARIDFRLVVRENHQNNARAVEGLLGCELNETLRGVLNGVESIERRGTTVTIRRRAATTLELGGLSVTTGREVSFRLNPRANGAVEISNIAGVNITSLPGFANSIYSSRLPIPIESVSLGAPNAAGERRLSFTGSGAIREAVARLDRNMTPQEILVEVVNPVQAFIDSAPNTRGRDAAIQNVRDRLRGTNTYVIRVSSNGTVDYGGLGTLSSMFSNAGDFLSFEGFLATGIGAVTGDRNAIPNAAIRTWNTIQMGAWGR